MVLGTAATYVAVSTGEAAGKLADRTPEVNAVLEHHEELAETRGSTSRLLTMVFAGLLAGPRSSSAGSRGPDDACSRSCSSRCYGAGTIVLANTAHNGGRLVHELGVRSLMPAAPLPAASADLDD